MLVNGKMLAEYIGISAAAITKLRKKNKLRSYGTGRPRFILAEALADYDKNVNQGRSLREAANKLDEWGQFNRADKKIK